MHGRSIEPVRRLSSTTHPLPPDTLRSMNPLIALALTPAAFLHVCYLPERVKLCLFHSQSQLPQLSVTAHRPVILSCTSFGLAALDEIDEPSGSLASLSTESFRPVLHKGLHRMNIAMHKSTSDQVFKSTPSLHRLRKQVHQLTMIDRSSLGEHVGLGLFAAKNIKAGTIIGLYPAHALGYELVVPIIDNKTERDLSLFLTMNEIDEMYFTNQQPHNNSPYLHATDQPIFKRQSLLAPLFGNSGKVGGVGVVPPPLYLDVNPNRNNELDGIWTSHYINDGSSLLEHARSYGTSSSPTIEDGIEQYYLKSTLAKNCIHIPFGPSPVLATITTKKIKKGQELFTSYGVVYWLGAASTTLSDDNGAPGMTDKIQSQIVQSARDLQQAMEDAKRGYALEMEDLIAVFDQLN